MTDKKKILDERGINPFSDIFTKVRDKQAPPKKRYLRSNHESFINNEISKAVMTRTRLGNCFLKNRTDENRELFCKQRNLCVSVLRKSKKDYFAKLSEKQSTDKRYFWWTVKPYLSKKLNL